MTICNQNRVSCDNLVSTIASCKNETIICDENDLVAMEYIPRLIKCKVSSQGDVRLKRENKQPPSSNDHTNPRHPETYQYGDGPVPFYDNPQPPEDVDLEW